MQGMCCTGLGHQRLHYCVIPGSPGRGNEYKQVQPSRGIAVADQRSTRRVQEQR